MAASPARRGLRRVQALIPRIALTSGEPAGIGPELCLAIARRPWACELVCLGDRALLAERARLTASDCELRDWRPGRERSAHLTGVLAVEHHPLAAPATPGRLDPANARYVTGLLDRAAAGALAGEFDAIVTAPVHKAVINDGGIAFSGHTEYLAARSGASRPVMMLATPGLRVALATTHLPLAAVSAAITPQLLHEVLGVLHADLRRWWRIDQPRIAVCGLNPHAGESGHLGDEEIRVIEPVLRGLRAGGMQLTGPVPADTAFLPERLVGVDAVLAMYHDQGLPVIKHAGFDQAVNITLGLPLLRTSVDHGTALELAGTGRASAGSLAAALELAITLSRISPRRG